MSTVSRSINSCVHCLSCSHLSQLALFATVCNFFCARALSDVQETAQYLAGAEFPRQVLLSLVQRTELKSPHLAVINTTPYDAHLERVLVEWKERKDSPNFFKSLSISMKHQVVQFCEQTIAMEIMQACVSMIFPSSSNSDGNIDAC